MITFQVSTSDGDGLTVRLSDVLPGEARRWYAFAVESLEGAARFERLEARLLREAAGWMRMMIEEMRR